MSEELIHVTRGDRVESIHSGSVAVADSSGKILASAGDPDMRTFFRSSAKPIQALNVLFSGALDRFGFAQGELAVMCGSHYAEDFHRRAVLGVLEKSGVPLDKLKSPPGPSLKASFALKQAAEGHVLDSVDSNCSGKHSGMLAACAASDYPLDGYMEPDHPVQRDILRIISEMCGVPENEIGLGEDGCGVPVHYMPLRNMALGYAKFLSPKNMPDEWARACGRIFDAMNAAPEMVAGTGGFCTELMRNTGGRLMAKLGAEGVYCVGVKDADIGIAVKIDDGNGNRPLPPVVMSVMEQLGLLSGDELERLDRFARPKMKNDHGHIVGDVRPVFKLKKI